MNLYAIRAIYRQEMYRMWRTMLGSIFTPVITTSLYFIVFGAAIGSHMKPIGDVPYAHFIVPGLVMMQLLTQGIFNASFGIHMPKFNGTIYEVLSAPVSPLEILLGYVGAAATKAVILGLVIMAVAWLFSPFTITHPLLMIVFLAMTALTFSLFGFAIGIWADGFDKLQVIPTMIVMPLTFLGGTFYSIAMLPPFWHTVALFNPIVYLVNGFRWSFFGAADFNPLVSLAFTSGFMLLCLAVIYWMFRTGYKLKV